MKSIKLATEDTGRINVPVSFIFTYSGRKPALIGGMSKDIQKMAAEEGYLVYGDGDIATEGSKHRAIPGCYSGCTYSVAGDICVSTKNGSIVIPMLIKYKTADLTPSEEEDLFDLCDKVREHLFNHCFCNAEHVEYYKRKRLTKNLSKKDLRFLDNRFAVCVNY